MKIYNSLSQSVDTFRSFTSKTLRMYVCGVTPYDTTHLGHAFTYVFFDTLKRYFQYLGYTVTYTQNVTDIDDDILRKAKEDGMDWQKLGKYWVDRFLADLKALNVQMPTYYVKATDSIPKILEITQSLVEKGIAYEVDGTVYFDVSKYKEYGKLSRYTQYQMKHLLKERGGNPDDPSKRNPLDFILWQAGKPEEPTWESPWGAGRPGWHIECSAMVNQYLGEQIDIHGGGRDLVYPHHESEIAQSESYIGKKPFAKFWMHTAMLMYQGEKMSKSLRNLVLVSDLLDKYSPQAIRYVLLSHHYRTPWEFFDWELDQAEEKFKEFYAALDIKSSGEQPLPLKRMKVKFTDCMEDDMNTPKALEVLHEAATQIITQAQRRNTTTLQAFLRTSLRLLGFEINK